MDYLIGIIVFVSILLIATLVLSFCNKKNASKNERNEMINLQKIIEDFFQLREFRIIQMWELAYGVILVKDVTSSTDLYISLELWEKVDKDLLVKKLHLAKYGVDVYQKFAKSSFDSFEEAITFSKIILSPPDVYYYSTPKPLERDKK